MYLEEFDGLGAIGDRSISAFGGVLNRTSIIVDRLGVDGSILGS